MTDARREREAVSPHHSYSYRRRAGRHPSCFRLTAGAPSCNSETYLRSRMSLIRKDHGAPSRGRKEDFKGRNEPNSSSPSSYLSTCGIHVSVGRTRKYTGKDTWSRRTALRAEIPRETASGLPRSPRSSAFFPTNAGRRDPFLPFTARPQVCPSSLPPPFRSRYRSNFPSDVRRDFRESKDPFSKDPILSRLSGTREPGLSRVPLPLVPFLSPRRIRYSFIYSLAVANNGSCFLLRGIDRSFRIRDLLRMYVRICTSEIRIARRLPEYILCSEGNDFGQSTCPTFFPSFFLSSIRCSRRLNVPLV